jgi:proline-specific peptidase
MMRRSTITAVLALVVSASCEKSSPPPATNAVPAAAAPHPAEPAGDTQLPVDGGKIWYRVSAGGNAIGTPVILLHGGPGFSSHYMKPFEELSDERPVVRYDQLGAGKSDHVTDTTLFTIPHFVKELDSLRSHLGYDKVHLVGHSWGTILAVEYYKVHPEHVASLTLGSAALDIPEWERHAKSLIPTLSDSAQEAIRQADITHKYDSPAYQGAINEFYSKYVWRHPVQADLDSTMASVNEGIYNYMQGPSEFTITGTLKKYDTTPFLKQIKVPVLYTVGEFDEANPVTIRRFADLTPGAQVAILAGAAHLTPWDAHAENVRVVREFLRKAEPAKAAVR